MAQSETRKRVLLVDDASIMARHLRGILEESGDFEVVGVAQNGAEALEKYQSLKPDIVCMDIVMPLLDGLQATRAILQLDAGARVVVISSVGSAQDQSREALNAGAKAVIQKPFEPKSILDTLRGL